MSSDKTATERLRELLDARGVHYVGHGGMVRWVNEDGCVCRAYTRTNPTSVDVTVSPSSTNVSRMDVSPEQAIEATLGSVTCHDASVGRYREYGTRFTCSECGATVDLLDDQNEPTILSDGVGMHPRYCPACGRKVIGERQLGGAK